MPLTPPLPRPERGRRSSSPPRSRPASPRRGSTSATIRPARITRMRSLMPSTSGSSLEIMMIAMPLRASSLISRWISAFAPTSMPRVGSSMMRMRGSVASHFDRPTFCWLPPESFPTIWPMPLARIWNCLTLVVGERALRLAVDEAVLRDPFQAGERDVLRNRTSAARAPAVRGPPAHRRCRDAWRRTGWRW